MLFDLVERLDGLPRHVALHPCGVLLSDATLLDRTPVEASCAGFPHEPVRQGRRRGPRPAQARRARHPDAVGDGPRRRRDRARRRHRGRRRRPDPGAARRPGHLRADRPHEDPRLLPDRVARPARADRQVRPRDVRRHRHRHLAVPARPGQVRHGHARSCRPGRGGATGLPAPGARAGAAPDLRRGRLPRAGDPDHRGR